MTNKETNELYELLIRWADNTNLAARNVFNKNKVARLIQKIVKEVDHWKDKPRGRNTIDNLKSGKDKRKVLEVQLDKAKKGNTQMPSMQR